MSDDLCVGFEPQTYLKDRCKRCFRLKSKHVFAGPGPTPNPSGSTTSRGASSASTPVRRHMSWREKVYGATGSDQTADNNDGESTTSNDADSSQAKSPRSNRSRRSSRGDDDTESMVTARSDSPSGRSFKSLRVRSDDEYSYKSARSGQESEHRLGMSAATSFESLTDAKSMVSAMSDHDSNRSSTPTDNLTEHDSRQVIRSIKKQLQVMEQKCTKLERENVKLRTHDSSPAKLNGTSSGDEKLADVEERLNMAESMYQDYREENAVLKCELRELQESVGRGTSYESKQLRDKLKAAEQLCEELMEENENYKRDVNDLNREIEESQDQFREEEIEEFREIQRELEQTAKNCRVLQFKLRKTERSKEQAETDRQHLEDKLRELSQGTGRISADFLESRKNKELESEMRIAKEVSVRLHNELEQLEEKRYKLEDENFYLKERQREMDARYKISEASKTRNEQSRARSPGAAMAPTNVNTAQSAASNSTNIDQLMRDLNDTMERETDLRDQLKFSEDDVGRLNKKLGDMETENEGLLKQLAKFTSQPSSGRARPPMIRSYSEGQAQIQLELAEHEAQVLKTKLNRVEKENESMCSQITLLEKQVTRGGGRTSFTEKELTASVPDTYYKQKIKILEEELEDYKHKFEEAKRAELEAQQGQEHAWKFGQTRTTRNKMVRSQSLEDQQQQAASAAAGTTGATAGGTDSKHAADLKHKLALVEQELANLRQSNSDIESKNQKLTEDNKRLQVMQRGSRSELKDKIDEMQKDIDRFVPRINDLEKEKAKLLDDLERAKKQTVVDPVKGKKLDEVVTENKSLAAQLKTEKNKSKSLESQLTDYQQSLSMSDNQKLVHMASKVEILNTQLRESEERYNMMHRRLVNGTNNGQTVAQKYEDGLRERCEQLERQLAETRTSNIFNNSARSSTNGDVSHSEIEKCCAVIETLETQVDRIYTQLEKLQASKDNSISSDTSSRASKFGGTTKAASAVPGTQMRPENKAAILGDVEKLRGDLESLMHTLQQRRSFSDKIPDDDSAVGTTVSVADSNESSARADLRAENQSLKEQLDKQIKTTNDLREQLTLLESDMTSAKAQSVEATNRLLQTEERWNKELDKMRQSYESQVADLKYYLADTEKIKAERTAALEQRNSEFEAKSKKVTELESQVYDQKEQLRTKFKELTERIDDERRKAKEYQTKYQKLEELFENERKKAVEEKDKLKAESSELKKKMEGLTKHADKVKELHEETKKQWATERKEMESKVSKLQAEAVKIENKAQKKASEMSSQETKKVMEELNKTKSKYEREIERWKSDYKALQREIEAKAKAIEERIEDEQKLKKEGELLKSRLSEQKTQLVETRKIRDEAREELNRWQQTWARERSELAHKLKQEEKVSQASTHVLQHRFESRLKISEETTKSLHSQLAQARRERDQYRDELLTAQKRLTESKEKFQLDEKEMQTKMQGYDKKFEEFDNLKTQIDKLVADNQCVVQEHETDKRLWGIERDELLSKLGETTTGTVKDTDSRVYDAMQVADSLRNQISSLKQTNESELQEQKSNLENHRRQYRKENSENQRRIRELQEQVKVLEIDRRNMLSSKDSQEIERTSMQTQRDTLMQRIHDNEIHQLANKYKLDKIAENINQSVADSSGPSANLLHKALQQLELIREDMAKTREIRGELDITDAASVASWRSTSTSARKTTDSNHTASTTTSPATKKSINGADNHDKQTHSYPVQKSASSTSRPYNYLLEKQNSTSSDVTYNNWEDRIAEIRKRSPSPSPRKMTAYPEAPPSMVLSKEKIVVYDKEGSRHWVPKQIQRSASHDPRANYALVVPDNNLQPKEATDVDSLATEQSEATNNDTAASLKSHARSQSSGVTHRDEETPERKVPAAASNKRLFGEAVRAIVTSGSTVRDRRKMFGKLKSSSIEASDTGKAIGSMGLATMTPGVNADSLQTSTDSLQPPVRSSSRTSIVGGIIDRFRTRSSSREPTSPSVVPTSTIGYRPSGYAASATSGYSANSLGRRAYTGGRQTSTESDTTRDYHHHSMSTSPYGAYVTEIKPQFYVPRSIKRRSFSSRMLNRW